MVQKNKILNAINEGIKAGFKLSSNKTIDDSSYIDFSDSKLNNTASLNPDALNKQFKQYLKKKDYIHAYEMIEIYGRSIISYEFVPKDKITLKKIIDMLVEHFGPNIDLNWIDVSNMTDLSYLFDKNYKVVKGEDVYAANKFRFISSFNGNISQWDVSNVKTMYQIFVDCDFNGDISKWDVSSLEDARRMFVKSKFNGDISQWDVSNVRTMWGMFYKSNFNGDISNWNTKNVTDMGYMFVESHFNQDISMWDTRNVKYADRTFEDCPIKIKNMPRFDNLEE